MVDLNNFWSASYYGHPALTAGMVSDAENIIGVKLPEQLIELLEVQNGGYTKKFICPVRGRTSWAEDCVPLYSLSGIIIDMDFPSPMNLMQSAQMSVE